MSLLLFSLVGLLFVRVNRPFCLFFCFFPSFFMAAFNSNLFIIFIYSFIDLRPLIDAATPLYIYSSNYLVIYLFVIWPRAASPGGRSGICPHCPMASLSLPIGLDMEQQSIISKRKKKPVTAAQRPATVLLHWQFWYSPERPDGQSAPEHPFPECSPVCRVVCACRNLPPALWSSWR